MYRMYRMYGMTRCHGWQRAAMYRMYGITRCHGKIIASCIIFISTIHGGHGKERRCTGCTVRIYARFWLLLHPTNYIHLIVLKILSTCIHASNDAVPLITGTWCIRVMQDAITEVGKERHWSGNVRSNFMLGSGSCFALPITSMWFSQ